MRYARDDFPINKGQITLEPSLLPKVHIMKTRIDATLKIHLPQCNLGLTTLVTRRMTFCPPP